MEIKFCLLPYAWPEKLDQVFSTIIVAMIANKNMLLLFLSRYQLFIKVQIVRLNNFTAPTRRRFKPNPLIT